MERLTILLPCLNEEANIVHVIRDLQRNLPLAEIVVIDNNSSDTSASLARLCGVRVIHQRKRGYGAAVRKGIASSKSEWILILDCDGTYSGADARKLWNLRACADMILGNRLVRGKGMIWSHRRIGIPLLSTIGNLKYGSKVSDWHSGLRLFKRYHYNTMNWTQNNFNFASEMIINFTKHKYSIYETEIGLHKPPFKRKSKLNAITDGVRCLSFILKGAH